MPWDLDSDRPVFAQLVERIQMDIVSGRYRPGERLPSVRELAAEAAVNPNTMQRAFAQLEQMGLVYTKRTSGRFITEDEDAIGELRIKIAREETDRFAAHMKRLGFTETEILAFMRELMKGEESWEHY